MKIHLQCENEEVEIDVKPRIEESELLKLVKTKLGHPDEIKLEQYNDKFNSWILVNESNNVLELNSESKFRVIKVFIVL